MLARRELPIEPHDTTGSLSGKLAVLGAEVLIAVLRAWERGEIVAEPQDDSRASYAPTLRKEDAIIDWALPADEIWRQVRAYNPWPVATTTLEGEPLRILEAWPLEDEPDREPGTVVGSLQGAPAGTGFAVRCGRGSLAIVQAQRAGRRPVSGEELLRGMSGLPGRRLGT
jgi:methionyl-tRNA formyltransferase